MNHQAIRNTHPNVVRIDDSKGAMDANGNLVNIDQAAYEAEVLRLEAEHAATEYKRLRALEYPAIGDQLDAILKHLNYRRTQGDELVQEMDDIIGDWLAVKARFPKNG
jgi:chemotaxis response regulator CheB